MPIIHRYIGDLENIEKHKVFCSRPICINSNILVVGTFNPSDESCTKKNDAKWFYGREQNKFWRYFPTGLIGQSLHPSDNHIDYPKKWKQFCVKNSIVIIDLVKSINIDDVLLNFSDTEVESKINHDLTNTNYFDIGAAFNGVSFKKVIYSLAWTDRNIQRLKRIRDIVNQALLDNGCIQDQQQIKYCKTPFRNDAFQSWSDALQ